MSKLTLKKEFSKGVTERHVDGFGIVKFDPSLVDEKHYEQYKRKGFDIFEEVQDAKGEKKAENEGKQVEGVTEKETDGLDYESMTIAQIKSIAKENKIDVTGLKKAEIIELIIEDGKAKA